MPVTARLDQLENCAVMVAREGRAVSGTIYDSRRGRPGFKPCRHAVVTCLPDRRTRMSSCATPAILTFATKKHSTKTDDDTERQLVHALAYAIVFIVSICYL